jgi:hypothetical protein
MGGREGGREGKMFLETFAGCVYTVVSKQQRRKEKREEKQRENEQQEKEWKKTINDFFWRDGNKKTESDEMRERKESTGRILEINNTKKNVPWSYSYLFSSPFFRRKGSEERGGGDAKREATKVLSALTAMKERTMKE